MAADVAEVPRGATAEQRLLEHAKYFDRIMSFLPANLTHKVSTNSGIQAPLLANTEYMHNKKGTPTPKIERALKKQAEQQSKKRKERSEDDESDEEDEEDEDESEVEEDDEQEEEAHHASGEDTALSGFSNDIADREVLKQRLRERLEELKKKRKAADDPEAEGPAKKKRRLEDKKKEKRRKEKEAATAGKSKKPAATPAAPPQPVPAPAAADIEFAQFDFGTDNTDHRARREKKQLSKKQRLQRALEVAQARQAARKEHGVESDASAAWAGMMARARGEKVLDDVARIKKTLRQDERKKKKSAREWNERLDMQKKAQAARLKQRERNIAERKKAKGKGKSKKGKRVGFEGGVRK